MIYRVSILDKSEWQEAVLDKDLSSPPAIKQKGDRYLVYGVGTGTWAGQDGNIVEYDGTGWISVPKKRGMVVYVRDECKWYGYDTFWQIVGVHKHYERPTDLLIYYGWPNSFNSVVNGWDNEKVAQDFAKFGMIVLGDGVQDPTHGDYANTQIIIPRIKALNSFTKIFGYVACDQTYINFASKVDQWDTLQVDGIFLDTAGYDYGTPSTNGRDAYNQKVDHIHSKTYSKLCFTNSWNMDHIIGIADDSFYPNSTWNPSVVESHLVSTDLYLLESFPVNTSYYATGYEGKDEWFERGIKARDHRETYGINLAGVSIISNGNSNGTPLFNFAFVSALMWGLSSFGSSDVSYGSSSSAVDFWERPETAECGETYKTTPLVENDLNDADVYVSYSEFSKFLLDFSTGVQVGSIIFSTLLRVQVISFTDTITLTNSPSAEREILGQTSWRLKLDLGNYSQYRVTLNVQTIGRPAADVHFEGSLDGSVWGHLDGNLGPEIAIGTTGMKDTDWVTLAPVYRNKNVLIRMMEKDGNGTVDPVLRQVLLHFK